MASTQSGRGHGNILKREPCAAGVGAWPRHGWCRATTPTHPVRVADMVGHEGLRVLLRDHDEALLAAAVQLIHQCSHLPHAKVSAFVVLPTVGCVRRVDQHLRESKNKTAIQCRGSMC